MEKNNSPTTEIKEGNSEQTQPQLQLTNEEREKFMKEIYERMKANANPEAYDNIRVNYKEELVESLKLSSYTFTDCFNSFLNYVNAKKGDEKSFFIKNTLINLQEKVDLTEQSEDTKEIDKVKTEILDTYKNIPIVENLPENLEKNSVPLIVDLNSFIDSSSYQYGPINKEKLDYYFSSLKNLGAIVILADMSTILNFGEYLKEKIANEPNFSVLTKSAIISKSPLVSFISIQKFELKTPTNYDNLKVQVSEIFDRKSCRFNKINDLTYLENARFNTYIYQIQQVSTILKRVS